jgi:hypothetical protein
MSQLEEAPQDKLLELQALLRALTKLENMWNGNVNVGKKAEKDLEKQGKRVIRRGKKTKKE